MPTKNQSNQRDVKNDLAFKMENMVDTDAGVKINFDTFVPALGDFVVKCKVGTAA